MLREAFSGTTRFAAFRSTLGIAPDVLAERLGTLVEADVLDARSTRRRAAGPRQSTT